MYHWNRIFVVAVFGFALVATAQADPLPPGDACVPANVLLVVDRSSSMTATLPGGDETKWQVTQGAVASLLETYGAQTNFGLMLYPGPSGEGARGIDGPVGACRHERMDVECTPDFPRCTTGEVVVPPSAGTEAEINEAMVWPAGLRFSYTPTWQSLQAAANGINQPDSAEFEALAAMRTPNARNFVVLVTDGWQCCGLYTSEDGGLRCEAEPRALVPETVANLRNLGLETFVVGFGASVDQETLHESAIQANTQRPGCDPDGPVGEDNRCYYQADNAQELVDALSAIARVVNVEVCNARDDDCDGLFDEGVANRCNGCGPEPAEICDGEDNDCDDAVDEGVLNACGRCGPVPVEICDGQDNDCDGIVDNVGGEGCACEAGETQDCYTGPVGTDGVGICEAGQQTCRADASGFGPCEGEVTPGLDRCSDADGIDGDCDGQVDEGGLNACGDCGPSEPESCNALDEDCDGTVDEGDLCPAGQTCACGGCVGRCVDGECPSGLPCVNGYCIEDRCPEGQYCEGDECVEGERDMGMQRPPVDMGAVVSLDMGPPVPDAGGSRQQAPPAEDCGCSFDSTSSGSLWWILALLALRPRGRGLLSSPRE